MKFVNFQRYIMEVNLFSRWHKISLNSAFFLDDDNYASFEMTGLQGPWISASLLKTKTRKWNFNLKSELICNVDIWAKLILCTQSAMIVHIILCPFHYHWYRRINFPGIRHFFSFDMILPPKPQDTFETDGCYENLGHSSAIFRLFKASYTRVVIVTILTACLSRVVMKSLQYFSLK